MRILFADKFPGDRLSELRSRSHEVRFEPDLSAQTLPGAVADAEILVVRSTVVTSECIQASTDLKLVIRAGAGTNTIDKDAARQMGVAVCNTPGKNAVAVAELTMGLILALDRNLADAVSDLRNGKWDKARYSKARGLAGQCIGIVGTGAIGLAVAQRARAFDMRVFVIDKPDRSDATNRLLDGLGATRVGSMDELVATVDIVTLHVPSNDGTRKLIDRVVIDRMKEGAVLINTSRGDVVDEEALLEGLNNKGLRAGLDVFQNEPGAGTAVFESALASHPGVYGSHHIGASTSQAQDAVAQGVLEVIDAYQNSQILNCVNGVEAIKLIN